MWNNVKPQESAGLHSHFVRYDDFCYVLVIKQTATQFKKNTYQTVNYSTRLNLPLRDKLSD